MKIFFYDICYGDKGIIIAESIERAIEMFQEDYPDVDPYNYDPSELDNGYKQGSTIDEICEYDGKEKLCFII